MSATVQESKQGKESKIQEKAESMKEDAQLKPLAESELSMSYKQALMVVQRIMQLNEISMQLDEENVSKSFEALADIQSFGDGDLHKTIKLEAKGKFVQFLQMCLRKKTQLSLPIKTFLPLS